MGKAIHSYIHSYGNTPLKQKLFLETSVAYVRKPGHSLRGSISPAIE